MSKNIVNHDICSYPYRVAIKNTYDNQSRSISSPITSNFEFTIADLRRLVACWHAGTTQLLLMHVRSGCHKLFCNNVY